MLLNLYSLLHKLNNMFYSVLLSMSFANEIVLITEKGKSLGDTNSVQGRLINNDVVVCVRHSQYYARDLRQMLPFTTNVDNG